MGLGAGGTRPPADARLLTPRPRAADARVAPMHPNANGGPVPKDRAAVVPRCVAYFFAIGTVRTLGASISSFGTRTVRIPLANSAVTFASSTSAGNRKFRSNSP